MRSILITAPILITGAAFATSAAAQQLPLPKSGGCPPGSRERRILRRRRGHLVAIPRAPNQGCRVGWVGHGAYRSRKADRR